MAARLVRAEVAETRSEQPKHTFIRVRGVDEDRNGCDVDSLKSFPPTAQQENGFVVLVTDGSQLNKNQLPKHPSRPISQPPKRPLPQKLLLQHKNEIERCGNEKIYANNNSSQDKKQKFHRGKIQPSTTSIQEKKKKHGKEGVALNTNKTGANLVRKSFRRIFRSFRLRKKVSEETLETPVVIKEKDNKKFKRFSNFFQRKKKMPKTKVVDTERDLASRENGHVLKTRDFLSEAYEVCMSTRDQVRQSLHNTFGSCLGLLEINVIDKEAFMSITGEKIKLMTSEDNVDGYQKSGKEKLKDSEILKTLINTDKQTEDRNEVCQTPLDTDTVIERVIRHHERISDDDVSVDYTGAENKRNNRESLNGENEYEVNHELMSLFAKPLENSVVGKPNKISHAWKIHVQEYSDMEIKRHVYFEIPNWDEFDHSPGSRCATPKPKGLSSDRNKKKLTSTEIQYKQIKAEKNRLRSQLERIRPISARRERVNKTKIDLKLLEQERVKAQLEYMTRKEMIAIMNKSTINKAKLEKTHAVKEHAEAVRSQKNNMEEIEMRRRHEREIELRDNLASSSGRRNHNINHKLEKLREKHAKVEIRRVQKTKIVTAQSGNRGRAEKNEHGSVATSIDNAVVLAVANLEANKKIREEKNVSTESSPADELVFHRTVCQQNNVNVAETEVKPGDEMLVVGRRRKRRKPESNFGEADVSAEPSSNIQ